MSDLISRQAALDALKEYEVEESDNFTKTDPITMMTVGVIANCIYAIMDLQSAEPELTLESAIDYLHSVGWLQEHDRILTESAEPEQRWIPVTERLPEDYEDVLVWFEYFRYGDYNRLYQTHGIGDYSSEYDSWMINHETGWHKLRVIAWMPLPEPYREERTEE